MPRCRVSSRSTTTTNVDSASPGIRLWRNSGKLRLLACASDGYLVKIVDAATEQTNFTKSLPTMIRQLRSTVASMGDNMDNGVAFLHNTAYLVNLGNRISKIEVDEQRTTATIAELEATNVSDVDTDGKHVYYVTLDGLISNLEHKDITLKLPCQEDEKFTHMKYGCGMLIAISYRATDSHTINSYYLISKKRPSLRLSDRAVSSAEGCGRLL